MTRSANCSQPSNRFHVAPLATLYFFNAQDKIRLFRLQNTYPKLRVLFDSFAPLPQIERELSVNSLVYYCAQLTTRSIWSLY